MNIYKIYRDNRIEAKTAIQAEEKLFEQNSNVAHVRYTADKKEAMKLFNEMKANLDTPKELNNNLYWFDGCLVEEGTNCDEIDEDTTIEDAFLSATNWTTLEYSICESDK